MNLYYNLLILFALMSINLHKVYNKPLKPDFRFTKDFYNVTIPENSIGEIYAQPIYSGDDGILRDSRMGIPLQLSRKSSHHHLLINRVEFQIIQDDDDNGDFTTNLFIAEKKIIGDFCFLLIRTKATTAAAAAASVFNRERKDHFYLNIKAFGFRRKKYKTVFEAKTSVLVTISDVNDLSPFFMQNNYRKVVPEDLPVHSNILQVFADDADIGLNGEVYYSFDQTIPQFSIHPTNGIISLIRPLWWFESRTNYEFKVIAQDRTSILSNTSLTKAECKIVIEVKPVNLFAPEIRIKHLPQIVEHSYVDVYAIVTVTDQDSGIHGTIQSLDIIDGDKDGYFRVRKTKEPNEYNIEVYKLLDREKTPLGYNLTLKACDNGIPQKESTKILNVRLIDLNDNSPVFNREFYQVRIDENAPINSLVTRVKVVDYDIGKNAEVLLEIVGGNEKHTFFLNSKTGVLYTAKKLDFETQRFYSLTVSAIDQGNAALRKQSSAKIMISVIDANDNSPIFQKPVNNIIYINENEAPGTYVTTVFATDDDFGENAFISYSIANNDPDCIVPFTIHSISGEIRTTKLLDYETMKLEYQLKIRASDWGYPYRRENELILKIKIRDVNDNRPQFEKIDCTGILLKPRSKSKSKSKSIIRSKELLKLLAIDFDFGAEISYRIISGNEDNCFYLDSLSGSLKMLCNFATKSFSDKSRDDIERELNITATDGTHFSDINRIRLKFLSNETNINKFEFNCTNTKVLKRFNDLLALSNENNNNNLETSWNRNVSRHVHLSFDENLSAPEFLNFPDILKIHESVPINTSVCKIAARDNDKSYNGMLIFGIQNGDPDSLFDIDMFDGVLKTIGYLDREKRHQYSLNISVSDLGKPEKSISALLTIDILDNNDNRPIISKSISTVRLFENAPIGMIVTKVMATDSDIGMNADIRYSLLNENHSFLMDSKSGLIRLKQKLDRELESFYELKVQAADNQGNFDSEENVLYSEAIINVIVDDVNDNPPKFHLNLYETKIKEDVPIGTMVLIVNAFDPDLGDNGAIKYFMKQFAENPFDIDPLTGAIRTIKQLDFESRQIYNLSIIAFNPNVQNSNVTTTDTKFEKIETHESETKLILNVIDVNENINCPQFFNDFVVSGTIKEGQLAGTFVLQVNATDADNDFDDQMIRFSIRGGDGLGLFSIDHFGVIRSTAVLDYETKSYYWLTVYAQDNGIVPLYSSIQVYVEVIQQIIVPLAEKAIYFVNISENTPKNTSVLHINLMNYGSKNNGKQWFGYRIVSNLKGFFSIDASGLITTQKSFDRELQKEHELEVEIFDKNAKTTATTKTFVVVTVDDVNDNSPHFHQSIYRIQIPFSELFDNATSRNGSNVIDLNGNSKEHFPILRVLAIDDDIGINAAISYEILSGSGADNFHIDRSTGKIFCQNNLQPGSNNELTILASDGGLPSRNSTCQVIIEIIEGISENVHEPICKNIQMYISENEKAGFLVTVIQATDKDNDVLWYDIIDGDDDNQFYIDRESGAIFLAKCLDWEEKSQYVLNVSITDAAHIIYIEITFNVIDVNDNRPEFGATLFSLELSENVSLASKILQLSATDRDNNNKLFYTLYHAKPSSSLKTFRIDSESNALVLSASLDREIICQHILTILVHDDGTPQLRNYVRISISVTDTNDFQPTFIDDYLEGKLYETAAVGSVVLRPFAMDHDKGENGRITYSIVSGNVGNTFYIDPIFGTVQLVQEFSSATSSEYTLVIAAADNGSPSLLSVIPAKIFLIMADNDAPKFSKKLFVSEAYENSRIGTFILHVKTKSMSSLQFEIVSGNFNNEFIISPNSGIILTQSYLDYEQIKFYNLTISATNMAGVKSYCNVEIHVLDINDNTPEFVQLFYVGNISEMSPINSLVFINQSNDPLIIKATDADSGTNSLLNFYIMEALAKKYFTIDPNTGAVKNSKLIDFELYQQFVFHVKVSDSGKSSRTSEKIAEIIVHVDDINDCIPKFEKQFYNVTLWLPSFKNVALLQIKATDEDLNSSFQYEIIVDSNVNNDFVINHDGLILLNNPQLKNDKYLLYIRVSDGVHTNITLVNVDVKNPVDTGLKFQKKIYRESIVESSTKVTKIAFLNLLGTELNEVLRYRILNPTNMFVIGNTSGVIQTTGLAFDRELKPYHELIVEACSNCMEENNIRITHTIVNVTVLDINDNCPMFVNLPYFAIVSIDDVEGTIITKVHAIDLDENVNGQVRYELKIGRGDLFEVVRETGDIVLKQNLKEHSHQFDMVVSAFDGGENQCQVQVNVHVKVIDRSIPIFQKQFYSQIVAENIEINSALSLSIKAESQLNRKLIYNIVRGNDFEKFSLDFNTAYHNYNGPCIIQVVDELDFETQSEYTLIIRATDSVTAVFAEVPVVIQIQDVNDCAPEFSKDMYNVSVLEALQPFKLSFLQIKTTDNDTGINKLISYSILQDSGDFENIFQIDSSTGDIYLRQYLDHETKKQHHFLVIATDSGVPNLSSTVHVWVNVLDVNDNTPQFLLQNYKADISIEARRNQFVTHVKAIDPDYNDMLSLKYNIISGNDDHIFSINSESGIVRVENVHNFGRKKIVNLKISVSDGAYTNFSSLDINILPMNLNTPHFSNAEINVSVVENQIPNQPIKINEAVDFDFGKFADISYSLLSEKYRDFFEIDWKTGAISVKKQFDREQQKSYSLLIKATDLGYRSTFITVNILVQDKNDNRPEFYHQEYSTTIYSNHELNKPFLTISAFDSDEEESSKIKYSIYEVETSVAINLFTIHPVTGELSLATNISQWESETFQFFIRAEDFGVPVLHSDVSISIFVASLKDTIPLFEDSLETFLNENTQIGTEIAILQSTNNISVNYRIVSNKSQFSIDEKGVLKLSKQLDYEKNHIHKIGIIAETDSSPPLSSFIESIVYVRDVYEASTKFESDVYVIDVSEAVSTNTALLKVAAYDVNGQMNSEIQYRISDSNKNVENIFETFIIDSSTGWIRNRIRFDYETVKDYEFYVTASDKNMSLFTNTLVNIRIMDSNDNPTTFQENSFYVELYENATIGDLVLVLDISDQDSEPNIYLRFHIISGDLLSQFLVTNNGSIIVSNQLDRESFENYHLKVTVTDGSFTDDTDVFIHILDVNDNAPYCFKYKYEVSIVENISKDQYLLKIETYDLDATQSASIQYSISGNGTNDFYFDEKNGILKTLYPLDRETQSKYEFTVRIRDTEIESKECTSQVDIILLDVNDNPPKFLLPYYSVSIMENSQIGTVITKIHAFDNDIGLNRKVKYKFLDSASDHFSINPENGIIILKKSLDRESVALYNLTAQAEDHGQPTVLKTVIHLFVHVLDANDNPPEFIFKYYSTLISESCLIDSEVLKVTATSKDIGINAEIMYSFMSGNEHSKFRINSETGLITVSGVLDYEKVQNYFLTVQAIDKGIPPLESTVNVNISIKDENDNRPIFSRDSYVNMIREDSEIGEKILQVIASDRDSGDNGNVTYAIKHGNRQMKFVINPNDGYISLANRLDRETTSFYVLEIEAKDHGIQSLSTMVSVNFEITDVNDNPPTFFQSNYSVIVQEDRAVGYPILHLNVTDADTAPNTSPFTFDIKAGNEANHFHLDADGILRIAFKLNYKHQRTYLLTIRVFDNGDPPLYSDTFVVITIIEESIHPPLITPLEVIVNLYQQNSLLEDNDHEKIEIGKVFVTDQDPYDILRFQLTNMTGIKYSLLNLFEIDKNSGALKMLPNLVDSGEYELNVTVSDGKFTTYSVIRIIVEMISDHMIDNAVLIRFRNVTAEKFMLSHRKSFIRSIRNIINSNINDIFLISAQNANVPEQLDLLFVARNRDTKFFYSLDYLRKVLNEHLSEIELSTKLMIEEILTQMSCNNANCNNKGICDIKIVIKPDSSRVISTDVASFLLLEYMNRFQCQCKNGYSGDQCQWKINECALDPCPLYKNCVPDSSYDGYSCQCTEGFTGAMCETDVSSLQCFNNNSCYIARNPISFSRQSFLLYKIDEEPVADHIFKSHVELSFYFRTFYSTGTLFYSTGMFDYNFLEIVHGNVQYRFDLGSGEGIVRVSNVYVSNGKWHQVRLERNKNNVILIIDGNHIANGSSPGFAEILNIHKTYFYIGAEIQENPSILGLNTINNGFIGCMDQIKLNGQFLPFHLTDNTSEALLEYFSNIHFNCTMEQNRATANRLNPCYSQPCINGGVCRSIESSKSDETFFCDCLLKFRGSQCQINSDPCSPSPCLYNGTCILDDLEVGSFKCDCINNTRGKRCEYGKYCLPNPCLNTGTCEEGEYGPICKCSSFTGKLCDIDINECESNPCSNGATCVNNIGTFHCLCSANFTGTFCNEFNHMNALYESFHVHSNTIYSVIIVILVLIILCILKLIIGSYQKRHPNQSRSRSRSHIDFKNNDTNREKIFVNSTKTSNDAEFKRSSKMSNLDVNYRGVCGADLMSPTQRPLSYTSSSNNTVANVLLNNLDVLRNYGSAADDLENLPYHYIRNLNKRNSNCTDYGKNQNKNKVWTEEISMVSLHDSKIMNDKKQQMSNVNFSRLFNTYNNFNLMLPLLNDNDEETRNLEAQVYHWDYSDWAAAQNPLDNVCDAVDKIAVRCSSSSSNSHRDVSGCGSTECVSHTLPPNEPVVDSTRDIDTLNEDIISECCISVDSIGIFQSNSDDNDFYYKTEVKFHVNNNKKQSDDLSENIQQQQEQRLDYQNTVTNLKKNKRNSYYEVVHSLDEKDSLLKLSPNQSDDLSLNCCNLDQIHIQKQRSTDSTNWWLDEENIQQTAV